MRDASASGDYRLPRLEGSVHRTPHEGVMMALMTRIGNVDQIALCGAPIEEHHAGSDTRWVYLEEGATYGIPYRSLLPREVEGVVVAGRCFSATHDAYASARSMGTCMAMGQAAGTAAALSAADGRVPRALSPDRLRVQLRADRADVGA
jgi:FAD dependent oxidoreductase